MSRVDYPGAPVPCYCNNFKYKKSILLGPRCHGTGLQTPLDEIPITLLDDTRGLGRLAGDCFTTRSLAPVAGSIAAVAMAGEVIPEPQCWTLVR
jgi:hypothetical protein